MADDPRRQRERYLAEATRGLWGRERGVVREELEAHFEARVAALMLSGSGEEAALEATLAELGASRHVNDGLGRVYAPPVVLGAVRGAWRQFRARLVESLLIIVAIALGVGVVVAVASFLDIDARLANLMGSSLDMRELSVQALEDDDQAFTRGDAPQVVRLGEPNSAAPTFDLAVLEAFRDAAPAVDYAYVKEPEVVWAATGRGPQDGVIVFGVTGDFLAASDLQFSAGSAFTVSDIAEQRPVVILSRDAVRRLGIVGDAVGQTIGRSGSRAEYTIVGVFQALAGGRAVGGYLPYAPGGELRYLYFAVDDPREVESARSQLADFAHARWAERVTVATQPGIARLSRAQRLTALAIALFASVGLMVASLNVMNLMLARVVRRGSSIAIRRSLGASRADVRKELLVEGVLLGLMGGVAGTAIGAALLWGYNRSLELAAGGDGVGAAISWPALGVGVLLAVGASLLFSLYPAIVGSRQSLIATLREI